MPPKPIRLNGTSDLLYAGPPSADGGKLRTLMRSQLNFAPYNPRKISPERARRLRESLERTGGILGGLVWNRRTGNLVAGHQRIRAMDVVLDGADYQVTVCVVNLDDMAERALNITLNNREVGGDFDLPRLFEELGEQYRDNLSRMVVETGFDIGALEKLCLEQQATLPDWLIGPPSQDEQQIHEHLQQIHANQQANKHDQQEQQRAEQIQSFKPTCLITFQSADERTTLFERLGLNLNQDCIDAARLLEALS